MSSSFETQSSELFTLPDLVIRHIINHLELSDLQILRLVCSITKKWVEDLSHFLDKCQIEISDKKLKEILKTQNPYRTFYLSNGDFRMLKNFRNFLEKYGNQIEHFKVSSDGHEGLSFEFLANCLNLKTLELTGRWPASASCFLAQETWGPIGLLKVFENIKNLSCTISCVGVPMEQFRIFEKFLKTFRNLETLRINFQYGTKDTNQWLQRQLASYLQLRSPHFKTLFTLSNQPGQNQSDRLLFPSITSPHHFTHEIAIDLLGIEKDFTFETIQEGFLSRVTHLSTDYLDNSVAFPVQKLKRIQQLNLQWSIYDFPKVSFDAGNTPQDVFKHLTTLHLNLASESQIKNLKIARELFGFENNHVTVMELELPLQIIDFPDANQDSEIMVEEFLKAFKKLRQLTLCHWFALRWVDVLGHLERLELHNIMLTEKDFIGRGPADDENPKFLRLYSLTHLTISNNFTFATMIKDEVFIKVFRRMGLKSLRLFDPQSQNLTSFITKDGIKSLINSPLAETIQVLPYPWHYRRGHPHRSYPKNCKNFCLSYTYPAQIYSRKKFKKFKQKHFKFFKI